jgi:hypothetical protein
MPPLDKTNDTQLLNRWSLELLVESYSNLASVIKILGFTDYEQIIASHTGSGDKSLKTTTIDISSIPKMLTVRSETTILERGDCFVRISLKIEGVIVGTLCAGYVTNTECPTYPNGKIESSICGRGKIISYLILDESTPSPISYRIPIHTKWRILNIKVKVQADANVANRLLYLQFLGDSGTIATVEASEIQTANEYKEYNFAPLVGSDRTKKMNINLTNTLELWGKDNELIQFILNNAQVDDVITEIQLTVEEWINV